MNFNAKEFLDKLRGKAGNAAETVKKGAGTAAGAAKKKAEETAAVVRANMSIFSEEDKIKKAQSELGEMYYNDFVAGAQTGTEAYQAVCDRITASKEKIAELKLEIEKIRSEDKQEAPVEADEITDADFAVAAANTEAENEEPAESNDTAEAAEPAEPAEPAEAPEAQEN